MNFEPKPNVSWSFYSAFSNNPIRFSDPHGDTAAIRYFTGEGSKEVRFVDGSWIDAKTRKGVSTGDVEDKSVGAVMNAYGELNSDKDMSPLMSNINTSSANIVLRPYGGQSVTMLMVTWLVK